MTWGEPAGTHRHAAAGGRSTHARPRHGKSGGQAHSVTGPWRWRRRPALILAGAAALGLVAGPAFAYFTAAGAGAGSAGTTTLQPVTVSSVVPSSSLLPGSTADLSLTVHNPNSGPVTILSVAQSGGVTVTGGGSGCTSDSTGPGSGTSGVSVPTASGLSVVVAGGATVPVTILQGVAMSVASAAGCQGASFQIPVAVAVQQ